MQEADGLVSCDLIAPKIKLKEAVWERRELLAHETAAFLARRHDEDVRVAEVQRSTSLDAIGARSKGLTSGFARPRPAEMAAHKDKTAREREIQFENELHSLRAANKTLQVRATRLGSPPCCFWLTGCLAMHA
jgi:hypothetical protein